MEVMVVVSIIALLMALVIPILGRTGDQAKIATCRQLIASLNSSTEAFAAAFGYYPKDYMASWSYVASESGTNPEQCRRKSTGLLLLALTHCHIDNPSNGATCPCKGAGPFFDSIKLGDNTLRIDGKDFTSSQVNASPYKDSFIAFTTFGWSGSSGKPAIQLVDPWLHPLVYDEKRAFVNYKNNIQTSGDYEKTDYCGVVYVPGADYTTDMAYKRPFLLYSLGPNGVDDTDGKSTTSEISHGDDIGNW